MFLAAPLRKQVIVKEKLVFPSGSESAIVPPSGHLLIHADTDNASSRLPIAATAQLISVLHEAPQPAAPSQPSLRNRYRSVRTEDEEELAEQESVADEEPETVETMGEAGWRALGGSFAASAGLTVSPVRPTLL